MQVTYEKLKQFYLDNNVNFREINHKPGASAEEYHSVVGCRYQQQLKCLLVKMYEPGKDYFVMVIIPANKRADFEKLKQVFNAKKVRGATLEELNQVLGCQYGEVPASGKIFDIPLVLDKDFLNEDEVYMNAGLTTKSFVTSPKEIIRVEEPHML